MSRIRHEWPGQTGAAGRASGRARVVAPIALERDAAPLDRAEVPAEAQRLLRAVTSARAELATLARRLRRDRKSELADLIDAHVLLLDDGHFANSLLAHVVDRQMSAGAALAAQRDELVAAFQAMDDDYLKSRSEDIEHVIERIAAALARRPTGERRRALEKGTVVVCAQLSPTEVDRWVEQGAVAIVQASGSPFSHGAILARTLGVPLVCGVDGILGEVGDEDLLLVDADAGRVVLAPDIVDLTRLREAQRADARALRARSRLKRAGSTTADGHRIEVWANADQPEDFARARRLDVHGIGLLRSEALVLRGVDPLDEEGQFRVYRDAALAMAGRPVVLRSFDLPPERPEGGAERSHEAHPALGLRGVRWSLARPAATRVQLRALLRAAIYGPLQLLLPMVTDGEQVLAMRRLLDEARASLAGEVAKPPPAVAVGAMIEVPSAALTATTLAKAADFLAIGSNDLVQYTLAADRNNASVSASYDPFHPAVLRLIAMTVEAATKARRPISVCGELAADPRFLPILIALGVEVLSVRVSAVLDVRERLLGVSRKGLRQRLSALLAAGDSAAVRAWVDAL